MPKLWRVAYRTNPIEIAHDVCMVADAFRKRFSKIEFGQDDIVGLLCGAIVADPPVNGFAIWKTMELCGSLVLGERLTAAKDEYIEAVRRIIEQPKEGSEEH
jgi:hypothetical protein